MVSVPYRFSEQPGGGQDLAQGSDLILLGAHQGQAQGRAGQAPLEVEGLLGHDGPLPAAHDGVDQRAQAPGEGAGAG